MQVPVFSARAIARPNLEHSFVSESLARSCHPPFVSFSADLHPKVQPGMRCEYEFEISEGKRRSQRVVLQDSSSGTGGGANPLLTVQRQDSRGEQPFLPLDSFCCFSSLNHSSPISHSSHLRLLPV